MIIPLTKRPHTALITGRSDCGKTYFILNLLEKFYKDHFDNIVFVFPAVYDNQSYRERDWVSTTKNVHIINPEDKLDEYLDGLHDYFRHKGNTLMVIDDCAATKDIKKKSSAITKLAFHGRHVGISIWILTQSYTAIAKDVRRQTKWIAMFDTNDNDDWELMHKQNDLIKDIDERKEIRELLDEHKYSKLIMKLDQPKNYIVHI